MDIALTLQKQGLFFETDTGVSDIYISSTLHTCILNVGIVLSTTDGYCDKSVAEPYSSTYTWALNWL